MNYVLSAYPLSKNFQKKLETLTGESLQYLLVAELRQKPVTALWKYLRSLNIRNFYLAVEDQGTHTLVPILQLIAKFALPKKILLVDNYNSIKNISSMDIIRSTINTIWATITINYYYLSCKFAIKQFLKKSPKQYSPDLTQAKNILYINANLWFGLKAGGSVGHIAGVVNALSKKNIQVDYAAVDKSPSLSSKIKFIALPSIKTFGIPTELNYYYFHQLVINYLKTFKTNKWDFIYQRLSMSNFSGVVLSRLFNIPLIIEYNGSEAWVAKHWGKGLKFSQSAISAEEICLKHAYKIVTISDVLKQELIQRGVAQEKIVFYPNCIDPEIYNPANFSKEQNDNLRNKLKIHPQAIVFTFVGTFGQWHGIDILAELIRRLCDYHYDWIIENNIHFMLVGDGPKMFELKSILGDHINKPCITLTGLIPQVETPAYLAISDVLLSPHIHNPDGSRFFGSPTKLFEYMAMGKAIVASDLEQIGEILKNSLRATRLPSSAPNNTSHELGILCQPGSVDELVAAVQFIAEQPHWREVLGINARKEAVTKYTWENHVNAFLQKQV